MLLGGPFILKEEGVKIKRILAWRRMKVVIELFEFLRTVCIANFEAKYIRAKMF